VNRHVVTADSTTEGEKAIYLKTILDVYKHAITAGIRNLSPTGLKTKTTRDKKTEVSWDAVRTLLHRCHDG